MMLVIFYPESPGVVTVLTSLGCRSSEKEASRTTDATNRADLPAGAVLAAAHGAHRKGLSPRVEDAIIRGCGDAGAGCSTGRRRQSQYTRRSTIRRAGRHQTCRYGRVPGAAGPRGWRDR